MNDSVTVNITQNDGHRFFLESEKDPKLQFVIP